MRGLTLFCCVATAIAVPFPQDFPGESEVELIEPVNTGSSDPTEDDSEGNILVFIRPRFPSFSLGGGGFPGFPGFGGFGSGGEDRNPFDSTYLSSVFGNRGAEEGEEGEDYEDAVVGGPGNCGLLCLVLRNIEGQLGQVNPLAGGDDFFGNVFSHNNDNNNGEFDVNNSTFTEEVLEDGTVVRINRTVLADTDENGNRFYFHSSVIHNVATDLDEDEVDVLEKEDALTGDKTIVMEVEKKLDESDPTLNEVGGDELEVDDGGVDDGLSAK